jgi:hypothetical protein
MDDINTVSVDTLKQQGFTDEDLQGFSTQQEPAQEPIVATPEPAEPTVIDPQQDLPVDGDVITIDQNNPADGVSKHVPYDRFKEVNEKNKIMAAELAALKAQYAQPTPQPNQQPTPVQQPQQQVNVEEQIAKMADSKAREKLKLENSVDIDDYGWQIDNPKLYRDYLKETAKEELKLERQYEEQAQVYQQNISFANELKTQQDFPVLYQFAIAELDELPGKRARVIEQAFNNIDRGTGSKDDIETVKSFAAECRAKMNSTNQTTNTEPNTTATVAPTTSPLDKAAGLPRSQNLSGSKTSAMSWAQVEGLIRSGDIDQIPKDMLAQIDKRLLE